MTWASSKYLERHHRCHLCSSVNACVFWTRWLLVPLRASKNTPLRQYSLVDVRTRKVPFLLTHNPVSRQPDLANFLVFFEP